MKIIVVGCGKVGSELARTLVNDGHNVSVIDNNPKSIDQISEALARIENFLKHHRK